MLAVTVVAGLLDTSAAEPAKQGYVEREPFIRVREVISYCPNNPFWNSMAPELKKKFFMTYWSEEQLRRHLEMLKAFGFNSLEVSIIPQMARNSGMKSEEWRKRTLFLCRTARELGLSLSQFVWASVDLNSQRHLDWHKPQERAQLEAQYREQAELAPYVDRVITHWRDPGGPGHGCKSCTIETAIEMHNTIMAISRAKNPKIRGCFSTWLMNLAPWPGYKGPGQLAASQTLDRESEVAFGVTNRGADGISLDKLAQPKAADFDAIAAAGRRAAVWCWYTADVEIEPALHVRTDVMQNYFRSLPPQAHTGLAFHTIDDTCTMLNMPMLYVAGHLMRDPSLDAHKLLEEFVRGFVGEANVPAVVAALRAVEQTRTRSRRYNYIPYVDPPPVLPPSWLNESTMAVEAALKGLKTVKLAPGFKPALPVTMGPAEYVDELGAHLEAIRQMLAFLKGEAEVKRMKASGATVAQLEAAIAALPKVVYDPKHTAGLEAQVYGGRLAALKKQMLGKSDKLPPPPKITDPTSTAAGVGAEDRLRVKQGELRVVAGEAATPVERRAVELFTAEVRRRTGLDVAIGDKSPAKYTLVIGTAKSRAIKLETDGFHLATTPDEKGRLYVTGQSPSGVMAGIGKLLRLSRYANGALEIPRLTLTDNPQMPVRGMYFATHFHNFYHIAPIEEVDRIIEELALWGCNSLSVWFDTSHFKSFQDPVAQTQLARLKHFGETAHRVGMQFGLTFVPNEIYNSDAASPKHLRADAGDTRGTVRATSLCPSNPEALALLGKSNAEMLDAFGPVDFIWVWPWDSGGCTCEECRPWGGKGFLLVSEQLSRLYRDRCPQGKVWLSTWCFDVFGSVRGEHDQFFQYVREKKPTWFEGIITGTYAGDGIQRRILHERPDPQRYPLTSFPEISMHMHPWGGYGIDPLPEYNTRIAKELCAHIMGGWPYSEGVYEDLNKFFWVQTYWNPQRTADDISAEYAAYYLGPEFAEDAVQLFRLMEKTNRPRRTSLRLTNTAEVDESWALAQKIDSRLVAWAKSSWRWRIIHIRAAIDRIAKNMRGYYATPEILSSLKPLHTELANIYHWDYSKEGPEGWVFHLPLPPDARDLSYLRPVTVSSSLGGYENSAANLVDGEFGTDNTLNFWVNDPAKEKTAWVCIDLGKPAQIEEVRIGFRGMGGKYAFVPSELSFEVSDDGKTFMPAGASAKVPQEDSVVAKTAPLPGASPTSRPWAYKIRKSGRYLRVNLGPSQRKQQPFSGTLELTEIQVFGKT